MKRLFVVLLSALLLAGFLLPTAALAADGTEGQIPVSEEISSGEEEVNEEEPPSEQNANDAVDDIEELPEDTDPEGVQSDNPDDEASTADLQREGEPAKTEPGASEDEATATGTGRKSMAKGADGSGEDEDETLFALAQAEGRVVTYPKPAGFSLATGVAVEVDNLYTIKANGETVDMYPAQVRTSQAWVAKSAYAYFDFSGTVTVEIEPAFAIDENTEVVVRPLSEGIVPTVEDGRVVFEMNTPSNLSIEFDGQIENNLQLFTNHIEPEPDFSGSNILYLDSGDHSPANILSRLASGTHNVVYFRPGVHVLPSSEIFFLPSNTTVYIAGGAVVYGRLHMMDAQNVKILGRGIVSGAFLNRVSDFGNEGPDSYLMRFLRSTDIEVSGIILQDSPHWTFVNIECERVWVNGLRIIGSRRANNDGLDIVNCRDYTIDHCFIRTIDDAVTVKAKYIGGERNTVSGITIQNTVIWNQDDGNALEVGFELLTDRVERVVFRNIDVLHTNSGGVMTIHHGDDALIKDVIYDDVRIENNEGGTFIMINIENTFYSTGVDRGMIDGVIYNNIRYYHPTFPQSYSFTDGSEGSYIRGLQFYDFKHGNEYVTSADTVKLHPGDANTEPATFSTDKYKFSPNTTGVLFEAEGLGIELKSEDGAFESKASAMSHGDSYLHVEMDEGESVAFSLNLPQSGHYVPQINLRRDTDGGVFRVLVDGEDLGIWADTYHAEGEVMQEWTLPNLWLAQGAHILEFVAIGSHRDSTGHCLGIDYINLVPIYENTIEAEALPGAVAVADGTASGGHYARHSLVGGETTLTFTTRDDRESELRLWLLTGPGMGTVSVEVNGDASGNPVSLEASTYSIRQFAFDIHDFPAGTYTLTLKTEGNTTGWLGVDCVRFAALPKTVRWGAVRLFNQGNYWQSSGASNSKTQSDTVLKTTLPGEGGWVDYNVTVPTAGYYTVVLDVWRDTDGGQFVVSGGGVENTLVGDTCHTNNLGEKEINLGTLYLEAGENRLRFTCVGKRETSTGYNLAIRYIRLIPGTVLPATDDAGILENGPTANYGSTTVLTVRASGSVFNGDNQALYKFDTGNFNGRDVGKAILRLTVGDYGSYTGTRTLDVWAAKNDWDESTVTWNTRPDSIELIEQIEVPVKDRYLIEVDVTEYLNSVPVADRGEVTFLIANSTDGDITGHNLSIATKEQIWGLPQLWIQNGNIGVQSLDVTPESTTLWTGYAKQLSAVILPTVAANDAELEWESSDPGIATVSSTGLVRGVSPGEADITVSAVGTSFSAIARVTVTQEGEYRENKVAVADTYSYHITPDTNYGASEELVVKAQNQFNSGGRNSFLRFDYSDYGGPSFQRAVLGLTFKAGDNPDDGPYPGPRTMELWGVSNDWEEMGLTWNNEPDYIERVATFLVYPEENTLYEIDITGYLNANFSRHNGTISFMIANYTDGLNDKSRAAFYSREAANADYLPYLALTGANAGNMLDLDEAVDYATTNVWTDGGVNHADSLQKLVELGLATITYTGASAGTGTHLADATSYKDTGDEILVPSSGSEGSITITLANSIAAAHRTVESLDVLLRTGGGSHKSFDLDFYYSTTADQNTFVRFHAASLTVVPDFEVYPYVRLSGFDGALTDVHSIRIVSKAVDGEGAFFTEIDLDFTDDDPAVAAARQADAETLWMSSLFADGMVVQRDKPIRVYGTGGSGTVTATLTKNGENQPAVTASTTDLAGGWLVELPAMAGSMDAYTLKVESGVQSLAFTDVLVGDVFVASGQSNMAMRVNYPTATRDEDISNADHDGIRFFMQDEIGAAQPMEDPFNGNWSKAIGSNIDEYSAVAYHFAKELFVESGEEIPVAVLYAAIPGTTLQTWMPESTLVQYIHDNPAYHPYNNSKNYNKDTLTRPQEYERRATAGYNAMINPLANTNIAGLLWYQGENNATELYYYETAFPRFVRDFRELFRDAHAPVFMVQLPSYSVMNWANFRQIQYGLSRTMDEVYLTVTMDLAGDSTNADQLHPNNKTNVGKRMAKAALALLHSMDVVYDGPHYESVTRAGNRLIVSFSNTASGLVAEGTGGEVYGFRLSENGTAYVDANAFIREDGQIEVWSDDIDFPVFLSYGHVAYPNPMINLYNGGDMPASPFVQDVSDSSVFVKLSATELFLYPSVEKTVEATVLPITNDQTMQWSTSDDTVAVVDASGKITAVGAGETTITAASTVGASSTVKVTVEPWQVYDKALAPTKDAYVFADSNVRDTNFGAEQTLVVKPAYAKNGGGERRSFIGFAFEPYGGDLYESVTLRLRLQDADTPFPMPEEYPNNDPGDIVNRTVHVYLVPTSWEEMTLTWSGMPDLGEEVAVFEVPPEVGAWTEIDLTGYFNDNLDELAGSFEIVLVNKTNGVDQKSRIAFWSRESAFPPELLVKGRTSLYSDVQDVAVTTLERVEPELPEMVEAKLLHNGALVEAPVVWAGIDPADYATEGAFTVEGTVVGYTGTVTANVTVEAAPPAALVGIDLVPPTKLAYDIGDSFDGTGMEVWALYDDNSRVEVTGDEGVNITGFDSTTAGTKTITVSYNGFDKTFEITVHDEALPQLTGIDLVPPTKLVYEVGDSFDGTGMEVWALYDDDSRIEVTGNAGVEITGFDTATAGTKTVTVHYGGFEKTFEVTVNEAEIPALLTGIDLVAPTKLQYKTGESFESAGMEVWAVYSNGSRVNVSGSAGVEISGFDSSATGIKTITVGYGGFEKTFEITVYEEAPPQLTGIDLVPPAKIIYQIGEAFDPSGLKVLALYADGSRIEVTSNASVAITGFESTTAGSKTITVRYEGFTATFTIEVKQTDDTVKDKEYKVLSGEGQKYKGEGTLAFTLDAQADKLVSVSVRGKTLERNRDYAVGTGSTVIVLLEGYLEGLDPGTYTIVVVFEDGQASTTFVVESAGATTTIPSTSTSGTGQGPGVATGDSGSMAYLFVALAALGATLILNTLCVRKKQRR